MAAARGDPDPRREAVGARARATRICSRLPILYRGALSSLSVARETSLDLELVTYLEGLCARAYFFVYGVRTSAWQRLARLLRARLAGGGARPVARDPGRRSLLTADRRRRRLSARRRRSELVRRLRARRSSPAAATSPPRPRCCATTLYDATARAALSIFAPSCSPTTARSRSVAFALGFAFGVPTVLLLVYNGAMLGAFLALFASHGLGVELGGWLIIHGTTEIVRDRPGRRGGLPDRLERGLPRRGRPGSPPRPRAGRTAAHRRWRAWS